MANLCLLWHFHQPYYFDIQENINFTSIIIFRTLQNYYPMGKILEKFPNLKINFNFTPTLLKQIKLISEGEVKDFFLNIFKEDIGIDKLLFFYDEFPKRFKENKILKILKEKIEKNDYDEKDVFDFKFYLHLICFNEILYDEELKYLSEKGRNFNEKDVEILLNKEKKILSEIIPLYKKLQNEGKIEISTSPFYHPILPLIYDTDIMKKTKTNLNYPYERFSFPEDAEKQIDRAISFYYEIFGKNPYGIWPSEGAISDEILEIFIRKNIKWTATDEVIIYEKINKREILYNKFLYKEKIWIFFRDHFISDLIGFQYQKFDEKDAAIDLINKIQKISDDKVITIILDGENPWDWYPEKGIKFLNTFYQILSEKKEIKSLRFIDICENYEKFIKIDSIYPGSWMGLNFDNWIGKEKANEAWKRLKKVREIIEKENISEDKRKMIEEIILNIEGSDWFWWYSLEVDEKIKKKFDKIFKNNLRKIYEILGLEIPEELKEEIVLKEAKTPYINPVIDGKITNFFEWIDSFKIEAKDLWMTFKPFYLPIKRIYIGYNHENMYIRIDFENEFKNLKIYLDEKVFEIESKRYEDEKIKWVFEDILEISISRKILKEKVKLNFKVNENFNFPPYGEIEILFKEQEWIV